MDGIISSMMTVMDRLLAVAVAMLEQARLVLMLWCFPEDVSTAAKHLTRQSCFSLACLSSSGCKSGQDGMVPKQLLNLYDADIKKVKCLDEVVGCDFAYLILDNQEGIFGMLERLHQKDAELVKHLDHPHDQRLVQTVALLEV